MAPPYSSQRAVFASHLSVFSLCMLQERILSFAISIASNIFAALDTCFEEQSGGQTGGSSAASQCSNLCVKSHNFAYCAHLMFDVQILELIDVIAYVRLG